MSVDVINRPEAADLDVLDVVPARELESSNHLLDDPAALNRFYEDNGYILLRGVFDPTTVARARDEMLAVAAKMGLVEPGDPTGRWTGKPLPGSMEESDLYAGIAKRLIEDPANLDVMEKVLGEPACSVPIVQYRTYPPRSKLGTVHQDGFYSPGIQDYRPVWITLTPCSRDMGGLALAVGQNRRGYFHNVGKPNPFPIPRDAIPDDSWATTDYMPGDVLVVHPSTPHCGLANNSDRLRISFDSRVQSAANPSAIAATVTGFTANTLTVDAERVGEITLSVDADSYLRPINPGIRESFEGFADYMKPGMRLVVVRDGDRTVMLRKAAEG
jgi:hypothetical protein